MRKRVITVQDHFAREIEKEREREYSEAAALGNSNVPSEPPSICIGVTRETNYILYIQIIDDRLEMVFTFLHTGVEIEMDSDRDRYRDG